MTFTPKKIIADFRNLPRYEQTLSGFTRTDWLIVFVLLAVGAAFRLPNLAVNSMWIDETWRIAISVAPYKEYEQMPLGYYMQVVGYEGLTRLMISLFGYSEWSVRIISGLAGTATVAATYALAKVVTGRIPALIAAAFMALSPLHISYSQEAGSYTIASLATIFFLIGAARMSGRPSGPHFIITAISAAIMGLAHIYLLLFVCIVLVLYSCAGWDRRLTIYLLLAGLFAILINVPFVIHIVALQDSRQLPIRALGFDNIRYALRIFNSFVSGPLIDRFAPTIGTAFSGFQDFTGDIEARYLIPSIKTVFGNFTKTISTIISLAVFLLTGLAAWRGMRYNRDLAIWIIASGTYLMFLVLQSSVSHSTYVRYAVPMIALFFVIYASILDNTYTIRFKRAALLTAMALLVVFSVALQADPPGKKWKPDVRAVATQIAQEAAKDGGVFFINPSLPEMPIYNFYLRNSACKIIQQPAYQGFFSAGKTDLMFRNNEQLADEDIWFIRSVIGQANSIRVLYIASERGKERAVEIANALRPCFSNISTYENGTFGKIRVLRLKNNADKVTRIH